MESYYELLRAAAKKMAFTRRVRYIKAVKAREEQ